MCSRVRPYPQDALQVKLVLKGCEAEPFVAARLVVREIDVQDLAKLAEVVPELDFGQEVASARYNVSATAGWRVSLALQSG